VRGGDQKVKLASVQVGLTGKIDSIDIILGSAVFKRAPGDFLALDSEIIGRLKRELVWTVGNIRAHGILTRLGFSCGQADALNPLLTSPLLRGVAALGEFNDDPTSHTYSLDLSDTLESVEHKQFHVNHAKTAQCWFLSGYLTGVFSGLLQEPLYFSETNCVAMGAEKCRFTGRRKNYWPEEDTGFMENYKEDNMQHELNEVYEQLSATKNRYQNIFEQANVPIFIVDPETTQFLDANYATEQLTGYSREEILKINVFDISLPGEHQDVAEYMKKLLSQGRLEDRVMTLIRKDGTKRKAGLSSKLMSYGGRQAMLTFVRDITDLKVAEMKEKDLQEQLNRSERLSNIGRLAASVAHELKNPLGAIKNAIYYIRDAIKDSSLLESDPHLKDILKLAEAEVDGSVTIIGELLDFSRVGQLVQRKTIINEMLEQIPGMVKFPDNIELAFDLDPTLPSDMVDPDRLNQVFCNITNNAIQAMPKGGTLKITTRFEVGSHGKNNSRAELIAISFEDTGNGIEPYQLAKIFEPLFTTKARGTGLGLAISNNIVEGYMLLNVTIDGIHGLTNIRKGSARKIRNPMTCCG